MTLPFHSTTGATKNLSVTTASANVNLIVGGSSLGLIQVRVYNAGNNTAFIRKGDDNTVTAGLTADVPIPPGDVEVFTMNVTAATGLWLAAIVASGTTTLYFTPGAGL